jgi:hypothetical protein
VADLTHEELITRRELFLGPLAALVMRMAGRALPAAGASGPMLWIDIAVDARTVVEVLRGDELVVSLELPAGRHQVSVPIREALLGYSIKSNQEMRVMGFRSSQRSAVFF